MFTQGNQPTEFCEICGQPVGALDQKVRLQKQICPLREGLNEMKTVPFLQSTRNASNVPFVISNCSRVPVPLTMSFIGSLGPFGSVQPI
jgi:hypothetical protein